MRGHPQDVRNSNIQSLQETFPKKMSRDRITKVVTTKGDSGRTTMADGKVHEKSGDSVELVGVLDEANSSIGVLIEFIRPKYRPDLRNIQSRLFDIGAAVATGVPQPVWGEQTQKVADDAKRLNDALEPLREFVLPGGGLHCAHAHMARTVVRRAERTFWRCASDELKESGIGSYLNRVSDYLFVLARTVADREVLWEPLSSKED